MASHTAPERVALRGMHCCVCGFVSSPEQPFGCERCGAHGTDFRAVDLNPTGTVLATVAINEHPDPAVQTPLVVGAVQTADGPVVRAPLIGTVSAGDHVTATVPSGMTSLAFIGIGRR
jgi:uncharacterized protein